MHLIERNQIQGGRPFFYDYFLLTFVSVVLIILCTSTMVFTCGKVSRSMVAKKFQGRRGEPTCSQVYRQVPNPRPCNLEKYILPWLLMQRTISLSQVHLMGWVTHLVMKVLPIYSLQCRFFRTRFPATQVEFGRQWSKSKWTKFYLRAEWSHCTKMCRLPHSSVSFIFCWHTNIDSSENLPFTLSSKSIQFNAVLIWTA